MGTRIYATMQNLADYYHVSYKTVFRIVHEMMDKKVEGILYVGRVPRIDTEKFEKYLMEKGNTDGTDTLSI